MNKGLKVIGIVVGIVIVLSFIFFMVEEKETNVNNKVTTIQLETAFTINESSKKYTLNQEDTNIIVDIINNLTYTKETCDGLPKYYIKYNIGNKKEIVTYGIEEYNNGYHITFSGKGEAQLSEFQNEELRKIINKYFN